tara:strand:+ start:4642 stop:5736 length:1095 start_codon:yes stop_codon:yes gene_type:complete
MTLTKRNNSKDYTAIESINGRRVWYATRTGDERTARKRARVYFDAVREENLAAVEALANKRKRVPTIGEVLENYERLSNVRRKSFLSNRASLRTIVREAMGKEPDNLPLTVLTGRLLSKFETLRWASANGDVNTLHRVKRTVHSTVRQAKSIFSSRMLQRYDDIGMDIPDLTSFLERIVENGPRVRYKAPKDKGLAARTMKAAVELKQTDPQAYIAFLLASSAGLRRSEIANARMHWIEDHQIHVQPDGKYDTKNSHEREIPLATNIHQELVELTQGKSDDDYLLDGPALEREKSTPDRLNKWLAEQGWTHTDKKMHELRKHYISQVSKIAGIHAAQHLAGHMDYSTTDRYYADPEIKVVVNES